MTMDNQEQDSSIVHVIHHGRSVSRKLKRRLTKRTIEEVTALKKQGKEAVNILVYAAEMMLTDPKKAFEQSKQLWKLLSLPEPENQARPETLEQLLVLMTRESARKMVHLSNYVVNGFSKIPRQLSHTTYDMIHHLVIASDSFMKTFHLQFIRAKVHQELENIFTNMRNTYKDVQSFRTASLERLAIFLSGRLEAEKNTINPRRRENQRVVNNRTIQASEVNGSY